MMKIKKTLITAIAFIPAMVLASSTNFEANVPVDHVFVPAGFDNNDNTEVVITGFLPNLCYKIPKSTVLVTKGKISVSVNATVNQSGLGFCTDVIVPFIEYVNIGTLEKGQYQLMVNEKSNWEKKANLVITEATTKTIDEAVYANVSEITTPDEGSRKVLLKGYNPSDCFQLKEIVIKDNGIDTYSILPIMKQVKTFCPKKMLPFTYEFQVPDKLNATKILLHVRVMDGRSVNAFFNNRPQD